MAAADLRHAATRRLTCAARVRTRAGMVMTPEKLPETVLASRGRQGDNHIGDIAPSPSPPSSQALPFPAIQRHRPQTSQGRCWDQRPQATSLTSTSKQGDNHTLPAGHLRSPYLCTNRVVVDLLIYLLSYHDHIIQTRSTAPSSSALAIAYQ